VSVRVTICRLSPHSLLTAHIEENPAVFRSVSLWTSRYPSDHMRIAVQRLRVKLAALLQSLLHPSGVLVVRVILISFDERPGESGNAL
jgi:hypothetical protein